MNVFGSVGSELRWIMRRKGKACVRLDQSESGRTVGADIVVYTVVCVRISAWQGGQDEVR